MGIFEGILIFFIGMWISRMFQLLGLFPDDENKE